MFRGGEVAQWLLTPDVLAEDQHSCWEAYLTMPSSDLLGQLHSDTHICTQVHIHINRNKVLKTNAEFSVQTVLDFRGAGHLGLDGAGTFTAASALLLS